MEPTKPNLTPPSPKRKRAATASQIEKELKQIYDAEGPADLARIERAKPRRRWPAFVGIALALFALAALTWIGIMRWGGGDRFGDRVSLAFEGPEQLRSGEVHTWTLRYRNEEGLPVARAEIEVRLPASVEVLEAVPVPTSPGTWNLGTLPEKGSGEILLKARLIEALDAPVSIQAAMNYRPANFNADFQKIATWNGRVSDSVIEATIDATDETVPGDDNPFTITVKKRTGLSEEAGLPDLKVRFDPGRAIVVKKAVPEFTNADERSWTAEPPAEQSLVFATTGSFAANANGEIPVRVEIGTLSPTGEFLLLFPLSATVKVLPGDLVLTLLRNGSTGPAHLDLGGTLNISVDYENKSEKPLSNVEISLSVDGMPASGSQTPVDWSSLSDLRGGKRSGNTLTWTKSEIPDLATVNPGEKGSVDLSIRTNRAVFTTADRNYAVDLSAKGKIGSIGDRASGKTVATPSLRTLLNTDAALVTAALYESGAIPPKSGSATTYKVVWTVTNSLHEIAGIKVSGSLPAGVRWENRSSVTAGDLRFDEGSRTVTWTLNRLPTSITSVSVDFLVSLTPGESDIGKTLPLISTSTFNAADKTTNAELTRSSPFVDTDLDGAPVHQGEGTVQP